MSRNKAATNGRAVQGSVSGKVVVKVHQPPSCAELHRAAGLSGEGSVVGVFRCKDVHRLNLLEEGKLSNFFSGFFCFNLRNVRLVS